MTTLDTINDTVHGEAIPLTNAESAYAETTSLARKALFAFAIATRYRQDGDEANALRWAQISYDYYKELDLQTADAASDHPMRVFGVEIPDYMHDGVVAGRFPAVTTS